MKSAGFEIVNEVLNGMEACQHIERECPDLIFLDINMPVTNGWEFLDEKKIKAPCKEAKVAILMSSTRPIDQERAENYSCVIAYLEKPLTYEQVEQLKVKLVS